jgi:hypothetical protein
MKSKKKWILILILIVILILAYLYAGHSLYIISEKTLVSSPVRNGDQIELSYLHSLYKTMQTEVFVIKDYKLCLDRMIFGDLNSLYYYNEQNLNYTEENGKVYLEVEDQFFDKVNLKANYSKTHSLKVLRDNKIIDIIGISKIFQSGTHIEIGIVNNLGLFLMRIDYY